MKKVLLDMHRLGKNHFNGLYTYSQELGQSLYRLHPQNIDLYYYLPANLFGKFGNKVKYISQHSFDKFFHRKAIGFDIWHSTTTLSWYMPVDKKTKFIFTIHDINFVIESPENVKSNQRKLRYIQTRINRSDHLIVISEFALSQAKEYLDLGNKPVSIVSPGCSFLTAPPTESTPSYIPQRPFLFSIGLVQKRKNFHVIIPLLKDTNYEYIIAGIDNFDYKDTIIQEAVKHGVIDRVKFTGPITEAEKAWYYNRCSAFMFPSFAEGFGSPVVEAMYYGKPVFLSNKTSLPEVGGKVAYYFDNFDPEYMKSIFHHGMEHYATIAPQQHIKEQAMKFSYDSAAEKILNIYQSF